MSQEPTQTDRDAITLKILGIFFLIIGLLVLVGTFWAIGNYRAVVVNLVSGFVLLVVGGIMGGIASRLKNRKHPA